MRMGLWYSVGEAGCTRLLRLRWIVVKKWQYVLGTIVLQIPKPDY